MLEKGTACSTGLVLALFARVGPEEGKKGLVKKKGNFRKRRKQQKRKRLKLPGSPNAGQSMGQRQGSVARGRYSHINRVGIENQGKT